MHVLLLAFSPISSCFTVLILFICLKVAELGQLFVRCPPNFRITCHSAYTADYTGSVELFLLPVSVIHLK